MILKTVNRNSLKSSISVHDKIGEGSYGSVFHICIYKDCKYILKLIEYNKSNEKYLINEIENQYILNKKFPRNIPKIKTYFIEQYNGKTYIFIIMDYLKNYITLDIYLENTKTNRDVSIFSKIIKLIEKINKENFIHGDLHSNNIMINKTLTRFYIIDFGYSVNYNKKNNINLNNIPRYLINSFDKFRFISNLKENYDEFGIEDELLRQILVPNIKQYIKDYEKINNKDDSWYTISF